MNPSFLGKVFLSFILVFHQNFFFCCRNGELGLVVMLTQSKQGLAIAPHTLNTSQDAFFFGFWPHQSSLSIPDLRGVGGGGGRGGADWQAAPRCSAIGGSAACWLAP